ncbi:gamma-glutamyltransferase family protein [Microbaculum sp. FT89]|uniref:gamma-glutamyltransferase family protein n=1 Tax=Microbaculum sp. FT89 TaxID=3447298 RepID=UPI003F53AEC9
MRDFESSGRSLVTARHGMIATSHPASSLVGIEILKAGGSAIDAAVAACAVQCVVEAGSTGIGGDCFAMLSEAGSTDIRAYNGSGRTPARLDLAVIERQPERIVGRSSPHAVTVPGAVEAWARLVADHGRMSLRELLAPAVEMARDGYAVSPRTAYDIANQRTLLAADPAARATFLVDGQAPETGAVQCQGALAATLEAIGHDGPDAFYRGEIAQEMVAFLRERGGVHTVDDFASAAGAYVEPIAADYRGWTVHECPPNGQGVIALLILKIMEHFDPPKGPADFETLRLEVAAARFAYAARDAAIADDDPDGQVARLLSDAFVRDLADRIRSGAAPEPAPVSSPVAHSDTVYISVVDRERNAVSFINSIFHPYGSGLMTPRAGVLFHNRGQSFSLMRGHPNCIAPNKRPMHTIIPGMLSRDGRVVMPFGVMGGHYQAMGHAWLLSRVIDHRLDLQEAIDLPRLFPLPNSRVIEMEGRLRGAVGEAFRQDGFDVRPPHWPIGGAQAVRIDWAQGTLQGASDPRKDGCALGY